VWLSGLNAVGLPKAGSGGDGGSKRPGRKMGIWDAKCTKIKNTNVDSI